VIQAGTVLKVADNSGAKIIKCIRVLGGSKRRYARIGDVIVGSVKEAVPRKPVKKHEVVKAVIVRQKKALRRSDGSYICFDDNAVVVLETEKEPKARRIFGPIAKEIKEKGFDKIATLADDIV